MGAISSLFSIYRTK